MAGPGPGREEEQQPGVCEGIDFVALLGRKLHQNPGLGINRLPGVGGDPYLTVNNGDPGSLVDLVVLESLTCGKVENCCRSA